MVASGVAETLIAQADDDGFGGHAGGSLPASLARRYGRAAAACRAARIPPDRIVGEVWPEQWLTLFRLLHGRAG